MLKISASSTNTTEMTPFLTETKSYSLWRKILTMKPTVLLQLKVKKARSRVEHRHQSRKSWAQAQVQLIKTVKHRRQLIITPTANLFITRSNEWMLLQFLIHSTCIDRGIKIETHRLLKMVVRAKIQTVLLNKSNSRLYGSNGKVLSPCNRHSTRTVTWYAASSILHTVWITRLAKFDSQINKIQAMIRLRND